MRKRERSGVNWQKTLKQKGVKQTDVIIGLGVLLIEKYLNLETSTEIIDKSIIN
jgi:hypothetical protein